MKKSIITMIAVVAIAAINLNVYLGDAVAWGNIYYVATSQECIVKKYDSQTNEYLGEEHNCSKWNELTSSNSSDSEGADESTSGDDAIDVDCEYTTTEQVEFDSDGDGIDDMWADVEITIYGTETSCIAGGSDQNCEEDTDCGEE